MPDSVRIKEIHQSLHADKYGVDEVNPQNARVANLGYLIERLSRVLGISVNSDGSIRPIRQSKWVPSGSTIPAGWYLGQFGRNQGGSSAGQTGGKSTEDKDGLAYQVRSNKFDVDPYKGTPTKLNSGGYVLVENIPQLIHVMLDDLDKGLGWQNAGANVLPSPNGEVVPYEGLNSLLLENSYMISQLSRNVISTHITALIVQATVYEILAALGLPVTLKELKLNVDFGTDQAIAPYPGLDVDAPTIHDLVTRILVNIAPLLGGTLYTNKDRSQ
jgi:hypothetical protein